MSARLRQVVADLRLLAVIGAPLIGNNLASIGVNVGDTLMASRLGAEQLAGVAIGSGIWVALFLLGLGIIMALGPTVAQHFGAGRDLDIGHDTRQGLWLACLVSVLVIVVMRSMAPVLARLGIERAIAVLAQDYLDALSFGVFGAYGYHVLKQMNEGVGRALPIMTVVTISLPINVLLNYSFLFGRFGAPALGAPGCGLGSGISFWLMFLMLAGYTARSPHYRRFGLWRALERPDGAAVARLIGLGLPIGLSLFLQSGLFTGVALLMAKLGTNAVAAHQITLNYCGLVFMVPLGFAMALTVRVGQAIGAREVQAARRMGLIGVILCGSLASVAATATLNFAPAIVGVYTRDPAVAAVALTLFRVAALLQFADGVQVAASFALRGLKDTRVPLLINATSYWGIGFSLAIICGRPDAAGAAGIWGGLAIALGVAAVLLSVRFLVVSGRLLASTRTAS